MTSEEVADIQALIDRSRPPRNGMEVHFLRVLAGTASACSAQERIWLQWVLDDNADAPKQPSVVEVKCDTNGEGAATWMQMERNQGIEISTAQLAGKDPSQEHRQKANLVLERICLNDFSCIRELREQRNPAVFELLRHLAQEYLEQSQSREMRKRLVRGLRKIYEAEHNTVLPDGGSIVNWGGLHDLRTWNW